MKTVVYLDALLLVNFVIAYFLLMAAGLLSGLYGSFRRMLAAAGLAAASALILLAPEMPYPLQVGYKIITAAAIAATAFGLRRIKRLAVAAIWYAALNILLGGLVLLVITQSGTKLLHTANLTVYLQVSPLLLMLLSAMCWGAVEMIKHFLHPPETGSNTIGVEAKLCGVPVRLRAVLDTGCHIKDPITCLPVLLISYPAAKSRMPKEMTDYLAGWYRGDRQAEPPEGMHLRLIPCATAAGQILLPGFALPEIGVIAKQGVMALGHGAVAFSPQEFGNGEYEALYGYDFL